MFVTSHTGGLVSEKEHLFLVPLVWDVLWRKDKDFKCFLIFTLSAVVH